MPEHSLEELQQLSQSALRHAELINIARTESPNGAYDLASSRWPRRQAKAVRFLAMVRRDYGLGAFEALVFQLEHARPNGSEHAQGGSSMNLDVMYPEGVRNVVFAPYRDVAPKLDDLALRHVSGNGYKDLLLKDEIQRLGLDEEQTKLLVRRIAEAMLAQWANHKAPQFFYGYGWGTATFAVRTFLSEDKQLYRRMLLATVVFCGGHTKWWQGLIWDIVPNEMLNDEEDRCRGSLQKVIDHLLAVGCTEDEVRAAWTEMIQTRHRDKFLVGYILSWYDGLKVGNKRLDQEQGIIDVARQMLLYELQDVLVKGYAHGKLSDAKLQKEYFDDIVEVLVHDADWKWCREEGTREIIEDYFVQCFARGAAGTTYFMLRRFGKDFDFWYRDDSFDQALTKLMRGGMTKAEEDRRYGIACALAEHLGEVPQADALREKARALGQKVELSFAV